MFNTKMNNGYQNLNDPNMNVNENGYQTMQQNPYEVYNPQDPYAMYNQDPSMMMQDIPYPTPPTENNTAYPQGYNPVGYAKGGEVKKKKGATQNSPYPMLAEMIRQQGNGEDTILAHINPLEAMMLKSMGGSGTINKKTGLPQFGLFSNPGKWLKSVAGGGLGVLLGNMILPGVGGMIGGALGGGIGSAARGRKDHMQAAMRGLGMGAAIPTAAGLLGSGLSSLGSSGVGGALSKYGSDNSIMPALSKLFGMGDSVGAMGSAASGASSPSSLLAASMSPSSLSATGGQAAAGATASAGSGAASSGTFLDKLYGNAGDFLSKPKNLLTLAAVGSSMANRPKQDKPKTPEQLADEQKRLEKALMLSPAERAAKEAELLADAKMHRSVARNKFLPEERLGNLDPIYRKSNTPDEQKRYGKWFNYYNNPDFSGEPMAFAEGGMYPEQMGYGAEDTAYPSLGNYIMGNSKGQDDDVNAKLSNGEFVIPADIVADLGDGNNNAGANVLYDLMTNVRKHKRGGKVKLPPKAKPLASYLKK